MKGLNDKYGDVNVKFTENQKNVDRATAEAEEAEKLANEAEKVTISLCSGMFFLLQVLQSFFLQYFY